jgi:hypothetical protein
LPLPFGRLMLSVKTSLSVGIVLAEEPQPASAITSPLMRAIFRRPTRRRIAKGKGPACRALSPSCAFCSRYGVTVSVCSTCVIPGVTFEVMLAVESYVPGVSAEAS